VGISKQSLSVEREFELLWGEAEVVRLAYGEHIIRCSEQDPRRVEGLLSLDGEVEKARKWMAIALAKREKDPSHIQGLVAYLFSHIGTLDKAKREWLIRGIDEGKVKLEDLTYEMLKGTHLEWRHIFALVGKEFNPTRERERIKRIYERLLGEG